MANVEQYPHYLFVVEGAANAVQDESGNWVEGEVKIKFHSRCREEVDGRGTEIAVAGGTFHKVTSLIQIPKGNRQSRLERRSSYRMMTNAMMSASKACV